MKIVYFLMISLVINFPIIFAEELFITYTDTDSEIIYDGKWSFKTEWKKSAYTTVEQNFEKLFVLRYAHNYEEILVFIDVIADKSINILKDKSVLCFKSQTNEKNPSYCFEKIYDGELTTLVKNPDTLENQYKKIKNHPNTLAISGISDKYNRYVNDLHISYEFKIPIDLIGRSDVYDFYVAIFDDETNQIISWPLTSEKSEFFILKNDDWGQLISPDKSIPEFPFPIIILIVLIGTTLIIQSKIKVINYSK